MTKNKINFFQKLLMWLKALFTFGLYRNPMTNPDTEASNTNTSKGTTNTMNQLQNGPTNEPTGADLTETKKPEALDTVATAEAKVLTTESVKLNDKPDEAVETAVDAPKQAEPGVGAQIAAAPADAATIEEVTTTLFRELGLEQPLLNAIADLGFKACTPIQAETLPATLTGKDIIGQAQTGTGKTAAFLITVIQRCLKNPIPLEERYASEPRALVIAPTRELVLQIEKDAVGLVKHSKLNVLAVVGGMSYEQQKERLRKEAIDILIATPGRLLDFLSSRDLYLDQVEVLVIDEADRMLDMGFIPDVKRIVRACSREDRQTLLFSATFSHDILSLSQRWTKEPAMIEIAPLQVTAERVEQIVYMVANDQKPKLLLNILKQSPDAERVIIFCNRRDETRKLNEFLSRKSISTAMISGELNQQRRLKTLEQFREGKVRVLVATDVAGRGIHVDNVSHVINYNLPEDPEDYVHRIGRTGRAGSTGVSISFACEDDSFLIPQVEGYIGMKLNLTHPAPELLE
jgi:ATP-dependent RNA helicase RhlB